MNFVELQKHAKSLTSCLPVDKKHFLSLGCFFCIPTVSGRKIFALAHLISTMADCIDYYPASQKKKIYVLLGLYFYVSQSYVSFIEPYINPTMAEFDRLLNQQLNYYATHLGPFNELALQELKQFIAWAENNNDSQKIAEMLNEFKSHCKQDILDLLTDNPNFVHNYASGWICPRLDKNKYF